MYTWTQGLQHFNITPNLRAHVAKSVTNWVKACGVLKQRFWTKLASSYAFPSPTTSPSSPFPPSTLEWKYATNAEPACKMILIQLKNRTAPFALEDPTFEPAVVTSAVTNQTTVKPANMMASNKYGKALLFTYTMACLLTSAKTKIGSILLSLCKSFGWWFRALKEEPQKPTTQWLR